MDWVKRCTEYEVSGNVSEGEVERLGRNGSRMA